MINKDTAYTKMVALKIPEDHLDLYLRLYRAIKGFHEKAYTGFPEALYDIDKALDWLIKYGWIDISLRNKIWTDLDHNGNQDKWRNAYNSDLVNIATNMGGISEWRGHVISNKMGKGRRRSAPWLEFIVYALYYDLVKITKKPRYSLISKFLAENLEIDIEYYTIAIMINDRIDVDIIGQRMVYYRAIAPKIFNSSTLLHLKKIFPKMPLPAHLPKP